MSNITQNYASQLERIRDRFNNSKTFKKLIEKIDSPDNDEVTITGLAGSAPSILLSNLTRRFDLPIIAITANNSEAEELYEDMSFLIGKEEIGFYPSLQTPPFEFRSPSAESIAGRISTLANLRQNKLILTITSMAALIEPTISIEQFEQSSLVLSEKDEIDIYKLSEKLVTLGFNRVPLVEEVGDFAIRGGLVDFFSPGSEYPVRIEFFGDEIETIKIFEVASQRTSKRVGKIELLPRREVAITLETIENYIDKIPSSDADLIRARYINDPDLPGLEWLATIFGQKSGSLFDFVSKEPLIFMFGRGNLKVEAEETFKDAYRRREKMTERFDKLPDVEEYYKNFDIANERFDNSKRIDFVPFRGGREDIIDFKCAEHPAIGARFDMLSTTLDSFYRQGMSYFIAADNPGQAERLNDLLTEKIELPVVMPIEVARLKGGYVCKEDNHAILTDHQIFGRHFRRTRKKKFKEGVAIQNYTSLSDGDYVVHTDYGIARYLGLKSIEINGRKRDCLHLLYAGEDKLYVPIEEFNRVSKYSGKDSAPKLSSMGGQGWEKTKARTKKAIADMAEDLLKIYAERKTRPGHAFGPDSTWMKQLEAAFPYDETEDQLKAITAIKYDMEQPTPTDRLICGDVGFGKTEVAVRAAFKAVEGGKQVAILVPTTILAQQHLNTFSKRLADFPVRVDMLSRFKTRKQQKEIVDDLAEGKVDIVIGTHRLFSKDIEFKDIGLLIIDEEQRFGVKHKEKLRTIKATVDTIALTATPIPRTLQMSLMGARDMSLINTSPKDRLPILTEICEFDPETIAESVLREIDRGGQVYFVHNRVQTINAMYRYLKKYLPQIEIAVAHGQMHEKSLEGIMLAFLNRQFQILLSTSIIESGLDIPSVNTIIINRADRFGLAQLYQLRGRVGRSNVHARAYLLTPPYRLLTPDARKRLRAIESHADLGSGFALAMKDLEIRGAGNILGAQQSGFIEEVGFDLYTKLLEEAVAELKGEEVQKAPETKIEIDMTMLIPSKYINIKHQKVEIYQKIAGARTLDDIEKTRDNVEDRFGRLPYEVTNLFDAAAVKISAWIQQINKVTLKKGRCRLYYQAGTEITRKEVEAWRKEVDYPLEFKIGEEIIISIDLSQLGKQNRLPYLRTILNRI